MENKGFLAFFALCCTQRFCVVRSPSNKKMDSTRLSTSAHISSQKTVRKMF